MTNAKTQGDFNWDTVSTVATIAIASYVVIPLAPPPVVAQVQIATEAVTGKTNKQATQLVADTSTGKDKKVDAALKLIFNSEGKCQNWNSDSGNYFQGRKGYTCEGIIPETLWSAKEIFSYCMSGFTGHPADSVKFCYDKDPKKFHQAAIQTYIQKYFAPGKCSDLKQPAFEACADASILSGIGKSRQFVNQSEGISDPVARAKKINDLHRQQLMGISSKPEYHNGWSNRKDRMDSYIGKFNSVSSTEEETNDGEVGRGSGRREMHSKGNEYENAYRA
jgi:Glycosyl hydrolase 108